MTKNITIAIDGFSSCGKSTMAKSMANKLNYVFVDSGAMYRAATLFCLENGISSTNPSKVEKAIQEISIGFKNENGAIKTILNDRDVSEEIRSMEINQSVSLYAAIASLRKELVNQQQLMGKRGGVIMDGRDIGTVVFPKAELKIFMTADPEIRAQRRYDELKANGQPASLEEVMENLKERDRIDSTREESPLTQAKDAMVLDNTKLTMEGQLQLALKWAQDKIDETTTSN